MRLPDLWRLRRVAFPAGERLLPRLRWTGPLIDREFAGVLDATPAEARAQLRAMDHTYPCNAAKAKYHDVGEQRVYAVGSYAHRPSGFFAKLQTHLRLFPHTDGTAVVAHRETNPYHSPRGHYGNRDGEWSAAEGVRRARELLALDETATVDGIVPAGAES